MKFVNKNDTPYLIGIFVSTIAFMYYFAYEDLKHKDAKYELEKYQIPIVYEQFETKIETM